MKTRTEGSNPSHSANVPIPEENSENPLKSGIQAMGLLSENRGTSKEQPRSGGLEGVQKGQESV